MDEHEELQKRVDDLIRRVRVLLRSAAPGPWHESESGYVLDDEGFVVAHLTPRRGSSRWDRRPNPNAKVIAESRVLLEELADALEALARALEISEGDRKTKARRLMTRPGYRSPKP